LLDYVKEQKNARNSSTITTPILNFNESLNSLRETKRQLKRAIAISKKNHWNNLIKTIDSDPFGKPYKIVMRKLQGPTIGNSMEPQMLQNIINGLFPNNPPQAEQPDVSATHDVELFSNYKINAAIESVKSKKTAPIPDGITNKIIAVIHSVEPCLLRGVFKKCIISETFPNLWKISKVIY